MLNQIKYYYYAQKAFTDVHKQYKIDITENKNCGDKVKAGSRLVIIICTKNGAISVYKRDHMSMKVRVKYPIIEIPGSHGPKEYEVGE